MVKENIEEVKSEKKCACNKKGIIAGVIVLVLIAVAVLLIVLCGGKKSNEKELTANLEKLGGQFYEKFYYPAQEKSQKDVKAFIAKFEKTGIKVNLENISKISSVDKELIEGMVNSKTKKECDKVNSYVVVTPKSPYGAKDYTVKAILSCGFDKKEEKKETTTKKETKTETKKENTKKEETKTETKKTSKK